jgi:flagellar hook protein FlgE
MGIFGAMTTAVSGLRAQSYALENISGNIANSQTTGFKRLDTSFVDLVPELPYRHELAGSVTAFSKLTNTIQGDLQSTGVPTNMALATSSSRSAPARPTTAPSSAAPISTPAAATSRWTRTASS